MDVRWGRNLIDVLIGRNKPSLLPLHLWSLALSERLTIPVLLRGQTWDLHLHPNKQSQKNPVKAENSVLGHIAIQRLLRFTGSNQSIFFLPAQRAQGAASHCVRSGNIESLPRFHQFSSKVYITKLKLPKTVYSPPRHCSLPEQVRSRCLVKPKSKSLSLTSY